MLTEQEHLVTRPTDDDLGPNVTSFLGDHLLLILGLVLLFALAGGAVGYQRSSSFEADSLILLQDTQPGTVFGSLQPGSDNDPEVFLNDQVAIITSTSLAQNVASSLGLPATLQVAEDLLENLTVTPQENSHAIELSFISDNPDAAIVTVNAFVTEYEAVASVALNGPYESAIAAVDKALAETQTVIDAVTAEIANERAELTGSIAARIDANLARIDEITAALPGASDQERLTLVAEANALTTSLNTLQALLNNLATNPTIAAQQADLEILAQRRTELSNRKSQLEVDRDTSSSPILARSSAITAGSPPPSVTSGAVAGAFLGFIVALGLAYWLSGLGNPKTGRRVSKY